VWRPTARLLEHRFDLELDQLSGIVAAAGSAVLLTI